MNPNFQEYLEQITTANQDVKFEEVILPNTEMSRTKK